MSTMASTTHAWWCAPELLVALITATTLLGCCSGTPVPVVVSTVYSEPSVVDVAADGAGNFLLLTQRCGVYRGLPNGTTVQLVAPTPRFQCYGIACDVAAGAVYVTGYSPSCVYQFVLSSTSMNTFAGNGNAGSVDGIGYAAQLNLPWGIVHFAATGLLYVTEYSSGAIRKIVVATANVTTFTVAGKGYLCITADGTFLYVATSSTIVMVNTSQVNSVTTLAGNSTQGFWDGVGIAAQFNSPQGIALNSDESALIIADQGNYRIRRLELSTLNVTTIAGNGVDGNVDGPGLGATFNGPFGAKWHCNQSSMLCGVLLADSGSSAVRFVAIERLPLEATSWSDSTSVSLLPSPSRSRSRIPSIAMTVLSVTQSASSLSVTRQRSGTQRSVSASPTVYCTLVPGGASGALASLHRVDVRAADGAVAIVGDVAVGVSAASDGVVTEPVSRQALLGGNVFAANMSLTLGGPAWTTLLTDGRLWVRCWMSSPWTLRFPR